MILAINHGSHPHTVSCRMESGLLIVLSPAADEPSNCTNDRHHCLKLNLSCGSAKGFTRSARTSRGRVASSYIASTLCSDYDLTQRTSLKVHLAWRYVGSVEHLNKSAVYTHPNTRNWCVRTEVFRIYKHREKVKLSLKIIDRLRRFEEFEASRSFRRHLKVARLSALRTGRRNPQGRSGNHFC